MGELISGIQREARQIRNVATAIKDIVAKEIKAPYKPNLFQSIIILGFTATVPEQLRISGFMEDYNRMAVWGSLEQYLIGLNDRVDFEGSGRNDIGDLVRQTKTEEHSRWERLERALGELSVEEREEIRNTIENGVKEVEFVERWIREKRDANEVTFKEIDIYRNIVNAIENVILASVMFGSDSLRTRTVPIAENMNIQSVIDKYAWVSGRNPQNEVERGVMVTHNVAMAAQIIDDWYGRRIDKALGVPSYALSVLGAVNADERVAKIWLYDEKDKYIERARELGLGWMATSIPSQITILGESILTGLPEMGRKYRIRQFSKGTIREKAYAERRI